MADHVSIASSLLPSLEPILGIGFALSLAYLGLPRFRYRQKIRDYVSTNLGDLVNASDDIKSMDIFKSVSRLGSIGEQDRKLFRKSTKTGQLHGAWSVIYEWFFECNQDRYIVTACAVVSDLLLVLGVSHQTGATSLFESYFTTSEIGTWIILISILHAIPVFFVLSGWYMATHAKKFADSKISDIKKAEATDAGPAPKPRKKKA